MRPVALRTGKSLMPRSETINAQRQQLAAMVSWHDQLMMVVWLQSLRWPLETSDVHMQAVAVTASG